MNTNTEELKKCIKMYLCNLDAPLSDYVSDEIVIEAFTEVTKERDALLAAAELAVERMKDTGDSVSINALEKAIKGVKG